MLIVLMGDGSWKIELVGGTGPSCEVKQSRREEFDAERTRQRGGYILPADVVSRTVWVRGELVSVVSGEWLLKAFCLIWE